MAILLDQVRLKILILHDDEDDNSAPASPIPSRKEYRVILRQEASSSPLPFLSHRLKALIHFDDEDDGLPIPGLRETENNNMYLRLGPGPDENTHE